MALDAWLVDVEDPPVPLVAAARALAAELDRAPRQSALWGRYLDALGSLLEHNDAAHRDDDLEQLLAEIRMEAQ